MAIKTLFAIAAFAAALFCSGCMGEGETDFRPTPGVINLNY